MRSVFWTFRRAAMVAVAVASVVGAGALTWVFVAGTESGQLSTAHLAAILALVVLPMATLAAWALDRRAARDDGSGLGESELFETPRGIEIVEEEPESDAVETKARARQVHPPHRRMHGRSAAGRRR